MSQWNHSDLKCWTLSVEKEPRRFLTPQHKFIERPEEAPASEVSGQALNRHGGSVNRRTRLRATLSHVKFLSNAPMLRISGQRHAAASTAKILPIPPPTTETTGPNKAAVNPDSSAPNSFEVPMKILFTEETRPRISSGVTS